MMNQHCQQAIPRKGRSAQRTFTRAGFSLIELLSVIVVVAILTAIIIPTVQNMRADASLSKSVSNLRSLQIANTLYSNEHSGGYVPLASWSEEGEAVFWHSDPEFRAYFSLKPGRIWPEGLVAPGAEITHSKDGDLRIDRAYGYNSTNMRGRWGEAGQGLQMYAADIIAPDEKLAFADALDWIIDRDSADLYRGEEVYTKHATAYRYNGRAAVVHYDGSATAMTRDEVVGNHELWDLIEE